VPCFFRAVVALAGVSRCLCKHRSILVTILH
jgi:hypothetical protein